MQLKPVIFVLLSALLLSFLPVSAVEVIQRTQPVTAQPGAAPEGIMAPLEGIIVVLSTWWLPLVIVAGIVILLIFLWKWWKTAKEKDNIFLRDYNRTLKLCIMSANRKRVHKRSFWIIILAIGTFLSVLLLIIALVTDNVMTFQFSSSVFSAALVGSLLLKFSGFLAQHDVVQIIGRFGVKAVGFYLGECITSDGYKNFLLFDSRKYVFWKNKFILKVNVNEFVKIETHEGVGDDRKRVVRTIKLPKDLLIEGDSVIAIKGEGIDKAGYFYYPLIADEQGNIINMDIIAYTRSKDVALLDTMYQQVEDFSKVQRQAINMNPNVRYIMRTRGDTISGAEEGG
jgi:hypothetical protein